MDPRPDDRRSVETHPVRRPPDRVRDHPSVGISSDVFQGGSTAVSLENVQRVLGERGITAALLPDSWPGVGTIDDDAIVIMRETVDAAALASAPRLRHVCRWGSGTENIDLDLCSSRGVLVSATFGSVSSVANAALLLVLAVAYRLPIKSRLITEGRWSSRRDFPGEGLRGRTVGIIGLGQIGSELARLLEPFAVTIIALVHGSAAARVARAGLDVNVVSLEDLARRSDYVVLTCSLNEHTHHLVDEQFLRKMKQTAYLVNVSRGEVVAENALVEALRSGRIAGAALDAFEAEPLPRTSPLTGFPEVILTPHSLAHTAEALSENFENALRQLVQVCDGERPDHLLNEDALQRDPWR